MCAGRRGHYDAVHHQVVIMRILGEQLQCTQTCAAKCTRDCVYSEVTHGRNAPETARKFHIGAWGMIDWPERTSIPPATTHVTRRLHITMNRDARNRSPCPSGPIYSSAMIRSCSQKHAVWPDGRCASVLLMRHAKRQASRWRQFESSRTPHTGQPGVQCCHRYSSRCLTAMQIPHVRAIHFPGTRNQESAVRLRFERARDRSRPFKQQQQMHGN